MKKQKIVIIGIDGASYRFIDDNKPSFKIFTKMLNKNMLIALRSTIPPSTIPAWMSIFTGVNPGKHGYFGFIEPHLYEYKVVNLLKCPVKRLWNILSEKKLKGVILNVPIVYPVEKVRGVMVAGMFAPSNRYDAKTVFPSKFKYLLLKNGYKIDVNIEKLKTLNSNQALNFLKDVIRKRTKTFLDLMLKTKSDYGIIVYTELDRMQHLFWYDRNAILKLYQIIEQEVMEIMNALGVPVILVSDHGFKGYKYKFIVDLYLKSRGYLEFIKNTKIKSKLIKLLNTRSLPRFFLKLLGKITTKTLAYEIIDWSKTIAYFQRDSWALSINLKGREPRGIVSCEKYQVLKNKLITEFKNLTFNGEKIFHEVHDTSKIYWGPFVTKAPDIVLIPSHVFAIDWSRSIVEGDSIIEDFVLFMNKQLGEHDMYGILGIVGTEIPLNLSMYDVMPIILNYFNLNIPQYLDGRLYLRVS